MDGKNCFCLLGPSSVSAVRSAIAYFSDEIQAHIETGRCPHGGMHPMPHDTQRVPDAEGGARTGQTPALAH